MSNNRIVDNSHRSSNSAQDFVFDVAVDIQAVTERVQVNALNKPYVLAIDQVDVSIVPNVGLSGRRRGQKGDIYVKDAVRVELLSCTIGNVEISGRDIQLEVTCTPNNTKNTTVRQHDNTRLSPLIINSVSSADRSIDNLRDGNTSDVNDHYSDDTLSNEKYDGANIANGNGVQSHMQLCHAVLHDNHGRYDGIRVNATQDNNLMVREGDENLTGNRDSMLNRPLNVDSYQTLSYSSNTANDAGIRKDITINGVTNNDGQLTQPKSSSLTSRDMVANYIPMSLPTSNNTWIGNHYPGSNVSSNVFKTNHLAEAINDLDNTLTNIIIDDVASTQPRSPSPLVSSSRSVTSPHDRESLMSFSLEQEVAITNMVDAAFKKHGHDTPRTKPRALLPHEYNNSNVIRSTIDISDIINMPTDGNEVNSGGVTTTISNNDNMNYSDNDLHSKYGAGYNLTLSHDRLSASSTIDLVSMANVTDKVEGIDDGKITDSHQRHCNIATTTSTPLGNAAKNIAISDTIENIIANTKVIETSLTDMLNVATTDASFVTPVNNINPLVSIDNDVMFKTNTPSIQDNQQSHQEDDIVKVKIFRERSPSAPQGFTRDFADDAVDTTSDGQVLINNNSAQGSDKQSSALPSNSPLLVSVLSKSPSAPALKSLHSVNKHIINPNEQDNDASNILLRGKSDLADQAWALKKKLINRGAQELSNSQLPVAIPVVPTRRKSAVSLSPKSFRNSPKASFSVLMPTNMLSDNATANSSSPTPTAHNTAAYRFIKERSASLDGANSHSTKAESTISGKKLVFTPEDIKKQVSDIFAIIPSLTSPKPVVSNNIFNGRDSADGVTNGKDGKVLLLTGNSVRGLKLHGVDVSTTETISAETITARKQSTSKYI